MCVGRGKGSRGRNGEGEGRGDGARGRGLARDGEGRCDGTNERDEVAEVARDDDGHARGRGRLRCHGRGARADWEAEAVRRSRKVCVLGGCGVGYVDSYGACGRLATGHV